MLKARILIPLALLLAGAFIAPYFLKGPDGKPLMAFVEQVDSTLSTAATRQIYYKWQDPDGIWHFGDEVPEGINAIPVHVDTAANILAPTSVPKPEADDNTKKKGLAATDDPDRVKPGLEALFNPKAAEQTLNDAKAVQEMLNERNNQLEQMTR
ncbi:DUF4124 domain-containing protein [Candidatus Thalassolituus haligoni]|uniref:DUF4124 domain-containing protein n=1 Tax=Candidatus Thalassolituus haligoni TaxID=3100113 RepID=UPI003516FA38|tara:strand:+ start:8770 stop:9231 length:462 start_codon:yes stop_codon:yes gene_type:complete